MNDTPITIFGEILNCVVFINMRVIMSEDSWSKKMEIQKYRLSTENKYIDVTNLIFGIQKYQSIRNL